MVTGFVKADQVQKLSVPPGFVSHTAFTLKRLAAEKDDGKHTAFGNNSEPEVFPVLAFSSLDDEVVKANLKLNARPWIIYDQLENCEEQSAAEQIHKVPARWVQEAPCSMSLEVAPVFHPTYEEFKDSLKYIDSIRAQVKPYGFCRIVPPPSWRPPCRFEEKNVHQSFKFTTQVQRVNEFQNHYLKRKEWSSDDVKLKKQRISKTDFDNESGNRCTVNCDAAGLHQAGSFQFALGPEFTLESFMKYANDFKECCFSRKSEVMDAEVSPTVFHEPCKPSEKEVEDKYWQVWEKSTKEIEVLCGANLDSRVFGSGFPVSSTAEEASNSISYHESGWNLNNISRLPRSLLSFEKDPSGVAASQLHLGMCFSTFPWKVEEHHLYALCYLHMGAPKIWYGVPEHCFYKFEAVVKELFPHILPQHPELLHKLVMQISPEILQSEGIQVHRCIQHSKEFVLFLPGAYHSGFDCGFNCLESVKFATLDWLPHGHNVVQMYHQMGKKTLISYDKLLLRASHEAVKAQWQVLLKGKKTLANLRWKDACGKDSTLAKSLQIRVKLEARLREFLSNASQWMKMDKCFDEGGKKECWFCCFDLYISASFCVCNPIKFSCLRHTKHLCSCAWSDKIFLYRYQIRELNLLVEAVEGKFTSAHRWVKEDLGQVLELDISNGRNTNDLDKDPSSLVQASRNGKDEMKDASSPCNSIKDAISKLVSESMARILKASSMDGLKSNGIGTGITFSSGDSDEDSGDTSSESN